MSSLEFLDSNIWLYALLTGQDERRALISRTLALIEPRLFSVQVINKVCVNLVKKNKCSEETIQKLIGSFFAKHIAVEMDENVLVSASTIRAGDHSFSYWDSLLVATALNGGAEILYSEDMQDGFVVDGRLKIVNPFKN